MGVNADQQKLKALCTHFGLIYNAEDPTESLRQVFRKIKGRISTIVDFDDTEEVKLPTKFVGENSVADNFMQSPDVEVCCDVKSRLLILFEIRPSIEYLNNVTKIDADKCFSRYGSIKFSQRGGLMRGFNPKIDKENASATGSNL